MRQYAVVTDFRAGLDTRRSVLTSVPGALVTLNNAHVNQGGEVEKREKFAINGAAFDSDSFGLENTDAGLVSFCSKDPAAWSAPTGVTYQRLYHPASLYGGTPSDMDSVIFSCNYNGKAFVCAHFADGKQFLYYNGTLIAQSWEGVVLAGRNTLAILGTDLERAIEREADNWAVTANATVDGRDLVYSPSGITFAPATNQSSAAGLLNSLLDTLTAQEITGVAGTRARAVQKITNTAGVTFTSITAPANDDGTGSVTLATGVTGASDSEMVANIVAAININTPSTGYSAEVDVGDNTTLVVFAPLEFGVFTYNLSLAYTGGPPTFGSGSYSAVLSVTLVGQIGKIKYYGSGWSNPSLYYVEASSSGHISVAGGTPSYTYAWSPATSNGISVSDATAAAPVFGGFVPRDSTVVGTFQLTVTDSALATASVTVNVSLSYRKTLF